MKIAVLMTCYNRVATTLKCLERLERACAKVDDAGFDIWLVDDASPDCTGEKVKSMFPDVNVIPSKGGLFWCKGMRLAWDEALKSEGDVKYDFFIWLNDDAMLKEDSIVILLAEYAKHGGVVSGKFSTDDSYRDISFGMRGGWMNGNLVLVPREVYERIGPIYDGYRHGYGDNDYGLMAKRAGFAVTLSEEFCGTCPAQPERYNMQEGKPFVDRVKSLFDPKGYNMHDAVLFRYRNWGIGMAIVCFLHMTLKTLFAR